MIKERQRWIDVAKGAVIVLVVLGHVATYLQSEDLLSPVWKVLAQALITVRMPAFFLLSGLFAARAFRQPFGELWSKKLYRFVYLFAVWSFLYIPIQMAFSTFSGLSPAAAAWSWGFVTLKLDGFLWYFAALAVFFLVAWLCRGLDLRVQLLGSFALSAVAAGGLINTGSFGIDHMAQYLFYFLAGCHLSAELRMSAQNATALRVVGTGSAWALGGLICSLLGGPWVYVANIVLPLLAIPAVLMCAYLIARSPGSRFLDHLGRMTLPIFVLHPAFVIFSCAGIAVLVPDGFGVAGDLLLPLILTAFALGASVAVYRVLRRSPLLFGPPAWRARARQRVAE